MYYNVHADKYCSDLLLLYWYCNNHRYTDRFFDTWVMYWWSCINIRLLYCMQIYISLPKMDQFLCRSEIVHLIFMVMLKTESLIYILTKHFNEIFHLHKILIYMIIILKMFLQINLIWLTHFDNNENIKMHVFLGIYHKGVDCCKAFIAFTLQYIPHLGMQWLKLWQETLSQLTIMMKI